MGTTSIGWEDAMKRPAVTNRHSTVLENYTQFKLNGQKCC